MNNKQPVNHSKIVKEKSSKKKTAAENVEKSKEKKKLKAQEAEKEPQTPPVQCIVDQQTIIIQDPNDIPQEVFYNLNFIKETTSKNFGRLVIIGPRKIF